MSLNTALTRDPASLLPEVLRLVETYAAGANRRQRQLFENSLRASLRVEELQAILAELGCNPQSARTTSDRHWTWTQRK